MVARQLRSFNRYDAMVAIGLFALLYAAVHVGQGMFARFSPEHPPSISLNPALLPYYAARSVLRMFVALALSVPKKSNAPAEPPLGKRWRSRQARCQAQYNQPLLHPCP
jgi:hypothetical protein